MQEPLDPFQLTLLEPIELPDDPCQESIDALSLRAKPLIRLYTTGEMTSQQESETQALLQLLNQKRVFEFIQAVNHEMIALNQLILRYNETGKLAQKTAILHDISVLYASIDARFPESVISRCPAYCTQFYDGLASGLRRQKEQLARLDTPASQSVYPDAISELLQKMPQDKLNRFLSILCDRTNYEDELEHLYAPTDPEYPEFKAFLESHSIAFLGGHNINNFEIKRLNSNEPPYVLKIEYRINQPKDIVQELYDKVDHFIQPSWSIRAYCKRVQRDGTETTIVRSIMTGPYFPEGNVYDYAMQFATPNDKIENALRIYAQMAEVLAKIDHAGGVFPDMKNTNWLILNGKLFIGDDKSIRRRTAEGYIDVFSEHSQWYGDILKSPEYMPPEVFETEPIRAEALYAFSWAKNLYEFLVAALLHRNLFCCP